MTSIDPAFSMKSKPDRLLMHERLIRFRNRLLMNAGVIKFAESFILTRPRARREAAKLFDLCSGFVYSQVLLACVRLGLLRILQAESLSAPDLALRLNLSDDATARLLTAAEALGLVQRAGPDTYTLGMQGAAFFSSPGLDAMVTHHALLYRDLADPVALLRKKSAGTAGSHEAPSGDTNLSLFWPYAAHAEDARQADVSAYTALMAATQPALADEIIDAVSLRGRRHVMDVGGGDGTFLRPLAKRNPEIALTLFDLPKVAALAAEALAEAGLSSRIAVKGGDFRDPLPNEPDTISLIRILLDHDDDTCLQLLRNVREALPAKNGMLILAEPMAQTRGAEKVGAYFSFYLMAMGRGRPRTEAQLRTLLKAAGFARIRRKGTRQPLLTQILLAYP